MWYDSCMSETTNEISLHTCYRCYIDKTQEEMQVRRGKTLSVCSTCFIRHYAKLCKTDAELKETQRASDLRSKRKRQAIVKEHLENAACMDCGYSNWIALEFDHREPKKKFKEIGRLLANGTMRQLRNEIAKCDIVCSNCHTIRTAKQVGSWRLLLSCS